MRQFLAIWSVLNYIKTFLQNAEPHSNFIVFKAYFTSAPVPLFKKNVYFMFMNVLPAGMCIYHMEIRRCNRTSWLPELQKVVRNHHVGAGTKPGPSARAVSSLNHWDISITPLLYCFKRIWKYSFIGIHSSSKSHIATDVDWAQSTVGSAILRQVGQDVLRKVDYARESNPGRIPVSASCSCLDSLHGWL